MKFLIYAGIVVLLVPLHTTVLPHFSIWDVKPDVGLVSAAMVGLLAGEVEGLVVGLIIGWVLNMYSAGDLWLGLVTKGGAGLLAGLLGRHVAQVNVLVLCMGLLVLSLAGGFATAFVMKSQSFSDTWWMVRSIALPQACFDAVLGAAIFWVVRQRAKLDWLRGYERY